MAVFKPPSSFHPGRGPGQYNLWPNAIAPAANGTGVSFPGAYFVGYTFRLNWAATDFHPPNLLALGTLPAPPITQSNDSGRTFTKGVYTDFAPPNLLVQILPAPPITQGDGVIGRVAFKGVYNDFHPPNLLATAILKPPPITQTSDGGRTWTKGVYTDFSPPNLLAQATLKPPPIAAIDLSQPLKARWIDASFEAPNFALRAVQPKPLISADISGIRLYTRSIADFVAPNLLTSTLAVITPPPSIQPAGRHKSREEAHERHHRDVLLAQLETFKEQRAAAERALVDSEDLEVKARTEVLKRVRVRQKLTKPLEQYAPVARAIAQRASTLNRYRDIEREIAQAHAALDRMDDEQAALHFMHFLMWSDEWRD